MADDTRAREPLPVTAEVASEGGSYADATHQVATFTGDVPHESGEGTSSAVRDDAAYAVRRGSATDDRTGGMVHHATEPSTREAAGWLTGGGASRRNIFLIGLGAGALAAAFFRRRGRPREPGHYERW
jgi:hypothetical protein